MFFYAITGLVNAITSTFLGLFVLLKNPKIRANQIFALFCLTVSVWSYSYYFWQMAEDAKSALFWARALMTGAIFIPIIYLHFILSFLEKTLQKRKILIVGYLIFLTPKVEPWKRNLGKGTLEKVYLTPFEFHQKYHKVLPMYPSRTKS